MESVACHRCGETISEKYPLFKSKYLDNPNKSIELYRRTMEELQVTNPCTMLAFNVTMTREDMISNAHSNMIVNDLAKKILNKTYDKKKLK